MPTTSRPGMGASMRMERAARAMARSSAKPSMRDSLTRASGLTSYWVTTGPVLVAVTLAGIWKLASFSSMIRMLRAWSRRWPRAADAGRVEHVVTGQAPDALPAPSAVSSMSVATAARRRSRSRLRRSPRRCHPRTGRVQIVWLSGAAGRSGSGRSGGSGVTLTARSRRGLANRLDRAALAAAARCGSRRQRRRALALALATAPASIRPPAVAGLSSVRRDVLNISSRPATISAEQDHERAERRDERAQRARRAADPSSAAAAAQRSVGAAVAPDRDGSCPGRQRTRGARRRSSASSRSPACRRPLDDDAGHDEQDCQQPRALAERRPQDVVDVAVEQTRPAGRAAR